MDSHLEIQRGRRWSDADKALFDRHVINLDQGKLGGDGAYQSTEETLKDLTEKHLVSALKEARTEGRKMQVMIQAHGGLVSEKAALTAVKKYAPQWKNAGIYPIYFVWETGMRETLCSFLPFGERDLRGWSDTRDRAVEKTLWRVATPVWGRMKLFAAEASAAGGGARFFAGLLAKFAKSAGDDAEFSAMGHSAGSIFQSYFLPALKEADGPRIKELFLLAPAIRVDEFFERLEPLIGSRKFVKYCSHFTMRDELERADRLVPFVYSKSLLYFVSGACEGKAGGEILGLDRDLRANPALSNIFGIGGSSKQGEMIFSTTDSSGTDSSSQSKKHGDFDDDIDTLNSLFIRMTGENDTLPFAAPKKPKKSFWKKLFGRRGDIEGGEGRKLALCVGIDQYRDSPLGGCVNDSRQWGAALKEQGFDVESLHDEEATRDQLIEGLQALVELSEPGDVIVFQYAGHGTHVPDLNGDEAAETAHDIRDEALVPFDYFEGEYLIDDDIGEIFDRLSPGVNLTCFLDCCHSGTGTRSVMRHGERSLGPRAGEKVRYLPTNDELRDRYLLRREKEIMPRSGMGRALREVTFAACQDSQTAKEFNGHGYFTITACPLMTQNLGTITNEQFQGLVLRDFPENVSQQDPHLFSVSEARQRVFLGRTDQKVGDSAFVRADEGLRKPVDPADLVRTMRDYMEILKKLIG